MPCPRSLPASFALTRFCTRLAVFLELIDSVNGTLDLTSWIWLATASSMHNLNSLVQNLTSLIELGRRTSGILVSPKNVVAKILFNRKLRQSIRLRWCPLGIYDPSCPTTTRTRLCNVMCSNFLCVVRKVHVVPGETSESKSIVPSMDFSHMKALFPSRNDWAVPFL